MKEFDFDLAEDIRSVRGAIDSQAWLLNNAHNAGTVAFKEMRHAARQDAAKGREALERLEHRLQQEGEK